MAALLAPSGTVARIIAPERRDAAPAASPDTFAVMPDLDSLARRAAFLDHVMLDDEAAMERARLGSSAPT